MAKQDAILLSSMEYVYVLTTLIPMMEVIIPLGNKSGRGQMGQRTDYVCKRLSLKSSPMPAPPPSRMPPVVLAGSLGHNLDEVMRNEKKA
ncbi:hypothetical protein Tco_0794961 [Tanacetum coccineum]